jgi:hypothetical protein
LLHRGDAALTASPTLIGAKTAAKAAVFHARFYFNSGVLFLVWARFAALCFEFICKIIQVLNVIINLQLLFIHITHDQILPSS